MTSKAEDITGVALAAALLSAIILVALVLLNSDREHEFEKNGCVVKVLETRSWGETTDMNIEKFCKEK